jgi:predicted dehydrogenase
VNGETINAEDLGIPSAIPLPKRTNWRLGFVGFGWFADTHLKAYSRVGWSVTAVAAPSLASRERARRAGVQRLYEDFHDLIADDEVDVILILTQPTLREEIVKAAAAARKPVLTEKPLALHLDECERMVRTAAEAAIPFAVSQNYRWAGANFIAHHVVQKGLIGTPFFASIEIYGTQDVDLKDHAFYSTCRDFLTIQWNTHLADLLRYWTGMDPERVFAVQNRMVGQNFVSDNLFTSIVDFGEGLMGHIVHSELLRSSLKRKPCRIDGDEGSIQFELSGSLLEIQSKQLGEGVKSIEIAPTQLLPSQCGAMGDLMIAIEDGREPFVSARRNVATMRQVLAEQASIRAGGAWQLLRAHR